MFLAFKQLFDSTIITAEQSDKMDFKEVMLSIERTEQQEKQQGK